MALVSVIPQPVLGRALVKDFSMLRTCSGALGAPPPPTEASVLRSLWVRAASFRDKDRADSLRGSLTLLNLPVEASSNEVDDQVWHLISVGPFKKEVEAQRVMTRLRLENLQPSLVTVSAG